ncbi:uncharacterized protein B0I36DRAFT_32248 [Microdochium trichocladiopsis]|uniref:Rhodopsin domain-containing protein n=1 Tax=Microdochium trichocladiopsis TaxID=1682393 RepID=A0A9P8XVT5_9PEZI|nr:uncharacterized protein B0I36DRAFT_32248 [Microdochium trichocladiopsis]KAH7021466.1 hypothetical protein B0I36DRAFT_32248 [Microdochium trichocladiopsis]
MSTRPNPQPPVEGRPNNHATIMGVQGFLTGFALSVVALRVWVRRTVLKTFSWDDWFILLSALFSIGVLVCFVGVILNGGGHYTSDLGVPEEWEALQHWEHILLVINITGVSVVKISVCLALLRFLFGRWYRRFLKFLIAFIIIFTISTEAPLIFRCWPRYYIWAIERPPGVCIPTDKFLIIANLNASINIVTDATLVLLPLPTIITLRVNIQTKASLLGVLFIGFFATAAAIVRAVFANVPAQISDSWSLKFYVWNSVELNLGIIAASLPTLRPLFSGWLESTASRFRSRSGGSSSRSAAADTEGADAAGISNVSSNRQGRGSVHKHGYRKQREAEVYAMDMAREWKGSLKNNAPVISSSRTAYGLENNSSEEEILASSGSHRVTGGITKHVEIAIQRSDV